MRERKRNDKEFQEEVLSFDLDMEEASVDPAILEKIKNDLQGEVINHPWTIGPLVMAGGSAAYAIALAPLLGGFLIAVPITAISVLVGLGNAGFRLLRVGEKYDEKIAQLEEELKKKQEEEKKAKIDRSVRFLRREFRESKAPQAYRAQKELTELVQAFSEVHREIALAKGGKFSATITGRFTELTKDAYKHGLRVLSCVLSLLRDDPSLDPKALKGDINGLEYEISILREKEGKNAGQLLQTKERELARLNERLGKIEWRDGMIANLLERSDACEEVMRSAREDLIKLRAENTAEALESVMSNLDSYVSVLMDVHEQIKKSREMSV